MKRFVVIAIAVAMVVWVQADLIGNSFASPTSIRMTRFTQPAIYALHTSFQAGIQKGYHAVIPDFDEYARRANVYLLRSRFAHTPMTGEAMADAAEYTYHKTGRLVPLELALAQAQLESAFGTRGKSPETNPYNVGENDSGTKQRFQTLEAGVRAYYMVVAEDYLKYRSLDQLKRNYVNGRNKRYATSSDYERKLRMQMGVVESYIEDNL